MSEPQRKLTVLSLGAGVQSTTLALMVVRGELPPLHAAIFADTGEEDELTYKHLDWLEAQCKPHFLIMRVSVGRLGEDLIKGRNSRGDRFVTIPAYVLETRTVRHDGEELGEYESAGVQKRQCTREYKSEPIERAIRRVLLGLQPRQRIPRDVDVEHWLGLSYDETARVARVRANWSEQNPWARVRFPLFEKSMTREHCQQWLARYPVPHQIVRSACVFCPYKSNAEWRILKARNPAGWARAVAIDEAIRNSDHKYAALHRGRAFVHRSMVPLAQADLREKDERVGQVVMDFSQECQGMCGV